MTDHKVSDFMTKKSYHAVTLVSKYPIKATSDTVSVDPLLLFQKLITVGYRSAYGWAMCISSSTIWGYWHHAAIRQTISSKCHTVMSTTFKYSNHPGYQLHLWWRCSDPRYSMENLADIWVTVWKVYWVCPKKKYDQPKFCMMATQVVLLQKTIPIWDGREHLTWKRQPRYPA